MAEDLGWKTATVSFLHQGFIGKDLQSIQHQYNPIENSVELSNENMTKKFHPLQLWQKNRKAKPASS